MGLFKKVTPKGISGITFGSVTDALWQGVVNIETASMKVSTEIPKSPNSTPKSNEFVIESGDGDGDYPVFRLDEKEWADDPNPLRPGWGFCVPFYRKLTELTQQTLLIEDSEDYLLQSYTLGYFPDQQEQLNYGKEITFVSQLQVKDRVFISDSTAVRGSGDVFIDVPLHPGEYFIYVIENSVRDNELDEYMKDSNPSGEQANDYEDYDVVRIVLAIHNEKIGLINKKIYPKNAGKLLEISDRLKEKNVMTKANLGPAAMNAVTTNFWVSIWSGRFSDAFSWNLHGLTFQGEFRKPFIELFKGGNGSSATTEEVERYIDLRGLEADSVKLPK